MKVIYEDNHIIIVNKQAGEIVQGDKTGDRTLADDVKAYIKEKYAKPGDVFLGVVRPPRPPRKRRLLSLPERAKRFRVSTICFARGKSRKPIRPSFQQRRKVWQHPMASGSPLTPGSHATSARTRRFHIRGKWLVASEPYSTIASSVAAIATTSWRCASHTGRHHQIRCQLSSLGMPIKGDLKYGSPRSNPDGSISLHARHIAFEHPVSHQAIDVTADYPDNKLWLAFGGRQ